MQYSFEISEEVNRMIIELFDGTENSLFLIVKYLRDSGFNQMQSIFLIAGELEINLMDANKVFLKSRVWDTD